MSWIDAWWQQVSPTAANGLQITLVGMTLVFLTLGLIIVALVLLTRLPGLKAGSQEAAQDVTLSPSPGETAKSTAADATHTEKELAQEAELEQVAAIAVALLRSRRMRQTRPKTRAGTSRWKQYGRAHQLGL